MLAADDPGMYSSQNEQDSHYYAAAAHIPMMDPADSAEALAFTRNAFDLSERFDVPFFIRSSVRVSHTKTPVERGPRTEHELKPYEKQPCKMGHDAGVRQAAPQGAAGASSSFANGPKPASSIASSARALLLAWCAPVLPTSMWWRLSRTHRCSSLASRIPCPRRRCVSSRQAWMRCTS